MARAGLMQAEIVRGNIVALIKGKKLDDYVSVFAEGMLKLSLGKVGYILTLMKMALQWKLILSDNKDENVIYVQDRVDEMLIPGRVGYNMTIYCYITIYDVQYKQPHIVNSTV